MINQTSIAILDYLSFIRVDLKLQISLLLQQALHRVIRLEWGGKGRYECAHVHETMSSDSDSNHSFSSEHSDGGDLPCFPTFSSPAKNTEQSAASSSVGSPGGITTTLSAATIRTPEKRVVPSVVNLDHFSPHQFHSGKKALEKSRKLVRKAEELAKRTITKRDRDEKVGHLNSVMLITVTVF